MSGNDFVEFPLLSADFITPEITIDWSMTNTVGLTDNDLREGATFAEILGDWDPRSYPPVSQGAVAVPQKYRMRGYRVATSQYEHWITTDPTADPPSGNALVAIVIEARLPSTA